jgi:hypothetical protein
LSRHVRVRRLWIVLRLVWRIVRIGVRVLRIVVVVVVHLRIVGLLPAV